MARREHLARIATQLAVFACAGGCFTSHEYHPLVESLSFPGGTIVFRDVRVFTGTTAIDRRDVIVRGKTIDRVVPPGGELPPGATIIEGAGHTLLPGFVDAHAHITGIGGPPWHRAIPSVEHNLQAHLHAGVTTILDLGSTIGALEDVRRGVAEGEWLGPDVRGAGPIITPEDGYPGSYVRRAFPWPLSAIISARFSETAGSAEEDAREAVQERIDRGAALIKIAVAEVPAGTPVMDEAVIRAVVEAAHARGRRVLAHVDTAANALRAARAGVDALAHGVHTSTLTRTEAEELARLGTVLIATLVTFQRLDDLASRRFAVTATERAAEPVELLDTFAPEEIDRYDIDPSLRTWLELLIRHRDARAGNVRRAFEAGVRIAVGSDANGSAGCFPGAIHEEMRLLVAAGIPAEIVLAGATSAGAWLASAEAEIGTIAAGRRADLVLVEGDPLADISATERIAAVVLQGRLLVRGGGPRR